jgi:hypothetical protein
MGQVSQVSSPNDIGNSITPDTPSSHALGADTQRQTVGTVMWTTEDADGTSRGLYDEAIRKQRNSRISDFILAGIMIVSYLIAMFGMGGAAR